MKKTLTAALLISTAFLASCTLEDPDPVKVPGEMSSEIEFRVSGESAQTKGVPINPGNGGNENMAAGKTFDIRCHEGASATPSFTAVATVGSGAKATLNPVQNWPATTVDMKFFAVHPRQSSVASTNTTMTVNGFTIDGTFANQQDLLYTYASQSSSAKTAVPLLFRHALTRVTFQMKLTGTNSSFTNVYVSKVELRNAFTTGTVTTNNTPAVTSWVGSNKATVSTGAILQASAKRLDVSGTGDASVDSPGSGTDSYWNIFADANKNNSFMMIPMTAAQLDAAGTETSIAVYLSVNSVERGPYIVSGLGAKGPWTYGKHINYKLIFDLSKEMISLEGITVAPWGPATDHNVELN